MSGKIFRQYIYFMKKNLYVLHNAVFAKKKKKIEANEKYTPKWPYLAYLWELGLQIIFIIFFNFISTF